MRSLTDGKNEIGPAAVPVTLEQKIEMLEREIAGWRQKYAKLEETYVKLSDLWNAFQATTRPLNRDVHRAEEAGEFARRLAEVLIRLSYGGNVEALMEYIRASAVRDAPRYESDPPGLPASPAGRPREGP